EYRLAERVDEGHLASPSLPPFSYHSSLPPSCGMADAYWEEDEKRDFTPYHRKTHEDDYTPVYRDADPVDRRQFPDIVYNDQKNEFLMEILMGSMQVILIFVLCITWFRARHFYREQQEILYLRHVFGEKEKETKSRSSKSRGNTSGGGKDSVDEDRDWLTDTCDWVYNLLNFKKRFKKEPQADGATTRFELRVFPNRRFELQENAAIVLPEEGVQVIEETRM
ncbi:hypothetical protein PMAYCL1PPCAC_12903, partial [Pristionchus mayeri]